MSEITAEETAWDILREDRNALLRGIDKYQGVLFYESLSDNQKQELITYRQALLDLPIGHTSAEDARIAIPQKPSWMI